MYKFLEYLVSRISLKKKKKKNTSKVSCLWFKKTFIYSQGDISSVKHSALKVKQLFILLQNGITSNSENSTFFNVARL